MGERVESRLAVVRAHAARTHPTEGQLADTHLQHRVVDAHAAGAGVGDHAIDRGVVAAEHIEGERLVAIVDEAHRLVHVIDCDHRQDGPEDLLLHQGRVRLHPGQHGGRQVAGVALAVPAADGGVEAAGIEQPGEAIPMPLVHDASVVG